MADKVDKNEDNLDETFAKLASFSSPAALCHISSHQRCCAQNGNYFNKVVIPYDMCWTRLEVVLTRPLFPRSPLWPKSNRSRQGASPGNGGRSWEIATIFIVSPLHPTQVCDPPFLPFQPTPGIHPFQSYQLEPAPLKIKQEKICQTKWFQSKNTSHPGL